MLLCMARIARVVVPGLPHHVTQRGVRSLDIFRDDADRLVYLELMADSAARHGVDFWAWCLMSNHVHLLVVPKREDSLAKGIGETHWRYTRHVNFAEDVRGRLFQGRFESYPVQLEGRLIAVGRYVELNPVKVGLVERAEDWPWSSAAYNVGRLQRDPLVTGRAIRELTSSWRRVLRDGEDELEAKRIERHLGTGRPLGGEKWVRGLERRTGRVLRPRKGGWPKGKPRGSRARKSRGN